MSPLAREQYIAIYRYTNRSRHHASTLNTKGVTTWRRTNTTHTSTSRHRSPTAPDPHPATAGNEDTVDEGDPWTMQWITRTDEGGEVAATEAVAPDRAIAAQVYGPRGEQRPGAH